IASTSDDQTVRLWDTETGTPIATLRGHKGKVNAVAFSPTAPILLSGAEDGGIYIWHLPEGTILAIRRAVSDTDAAYLFTPAGPTASLGRDACAARALATCRIGPYSFPIDVCEERFYTPGLLPKLLAGDTAYLEPEVEQIPLVCPSSSP